MDVDEMVPDENDAQGRDGFSVSPDRWPILLQSEARPHRGAGHQAAPQPQPQPAPGAGWTPDDAAMWARLSLARKRKWRRAADGELISPFDGSKVPDDWRAREQHIQHHERLARIAAVCGLPPVEPVTPDYAHRVEIARHHARVTVASLCTGVLILAIVVFALTWP